MKLPLYTLVPRSTVGSKPSCDAGTKRPLRFFFAPLMIPGQRAVVTKPPGYRPQDCRLPVSLVLTRLDKQDIGNYGLFNQYEFTKLMFAAHPSAGVDWSSAWWGIKALDWEQQSLSGHKASAILRDCGLGPQQEPAASSKEPPTAENFDIFDAAFLKGSGLVGNFHSGAASKANKSEPECNNHLPKEQDEPDLPSFQDLFSESDAEFSDGGEIVDEIRDEGPVKNGDGVEVRVGPCRDQDEGNQRAARTVATDKGLIAQSLGNKPPALD